MEDHQEMKKPDVSLPTAKPLKGWRGWLPIVGAGVLMLGYDVSPVDLVPDLVPIAGLVDDATLSVAAIAFMVWRYRKMKG